MIITITGMPGSGKSTLAKSLATKLGFKRYYIGGIRRELAKKKGMTLTQYNKFGEKDPSTDIEVDNYQKEIAQKEDDIILEGRTSFFLIPNSVKIFVDVSLEEGAKRIFSDLVNNKKERVNESEADNVEDVKKQLKERIASDNRRYKKYYGIEDVYDSNNFDIVIDSTDMKKEETFKEALNKLQQYL